MKTARGIFHEFFPDRCMDGGELGWSHRHQCDELDAEWRRLVEEAQGETKSWMERSIAIQKQEEEVEAEAQTERENLTAQVRQLMGERDRERAAHDFAADVLKTVQAERDRLKGDLAEARSIVADLLLYAKQDAAAQARHRAQRCLDRIAATPAEQAQPTDELCPCGCGHDMATVQAEAHGAGQEQALSDVITWLLEEGADDLVRKIETGEWHEIRGRRQGQDYEVSRPRSVELDQTAEQAQPTGRDLDICARPKCKSPRHYNIHDPERAGHVFVEPAEQAQGEVAKCGIRKAFTGEPCQNDAAPPGFKTCAEHKASFERLSDNGLLAQVNARLDALDQRETDNAILFSGQIAELNAQVAALAKRMDELTTHMEVLDLRVGRLEQIPPVDYAHYHEFRQWERDGWPDRCGVRVREGDAPQCLQPAAWSGHRKTAVEEPHRFMPIALDEDRCVFDLSRHPWIRCGRRQADAVHAVPPIAGGGAR